MLLLSQVGKTCLQETNLNARKPGAEAQHGQGSFEVIKKLEAMYTLKWQQSRKDGSYQLSL